MPTPDFWDGRYAEPGWAYGEAPNAFVAAQAHRFAPGDAVLDLASGEGRNAAFLAHHGCRVTAVDTSAEGLAKTARLPGGDAVETICADLVTWSPARTWDGAVATFVHLPPAARPDLFRRMQAWLRPGGLLVAEWYRPAHRERGLAGGPPDAAMMVGADDLRAHFGADGMLLLEEADVTLAEGAYHVGPSAVVRFVWRRPGGAPESKAGA